MPPRKPRRSIEERALRVAARMSAGTILGRSESASPSRRLNDARIGQQLQSQDVHVLLMTIPGSVSAQTYALTYAPQFSGSIINVWGNTSANVTSDCVFQVLKNGSTIYPSATKPKVANGAQVGTPAIPDTSTFVAGDKFQVQVTSVGTASDLVVSILMRFSL